MEDTKGLADGRLSLSSDEPDVSSIYLVPGLQSGGEVLMERRCLFVVSL